jgi:hypothetical protein
MLAFFISVAFSASKIVVSSIDRKYTINDNLISVSVNVDYRNDGDSPVHTVLYSLTPRESVHVGLVTSSSQRSTSRDFSASLPISVTGSLVTITLGSPLKPGSAITLYISYTLGNYFLFAKPTITLNQRITAFFNTTAFYSGPYPVLQSSLSVDGFPSNSVGHCSNLTGLSVQRARISLASTEQTSSDLEFEFTTSKPLPYIAQIRSQTYVSHWGKSKQQAFYEVENAGPKCAGEFNRIDFTSRTPCFLQTVPLTPPKGSYAFWARDEGGQLQRDIPHHGDEIDIPLRGPMLSSWKATFTTGWTVETNRFVSGNFRFRAELVTPTFPAPIGKVVADFVLPEGARFGSVEIPIDANVSQYTEIANLDLNGRVVVHVETGRIGSTDKIPVVIDYKLSPWANFLKIALLGGAFCILFIAIVICRRIDLGIRVEQGKGRKAKTD